MKYSRVLVLLLMVSAVNMLSAQTNVTLGSTQLVDVSERQLRILKEAEKLPDFQRKKILLDSLYTPFSILWDSQWPNADAFASWMLDTGLSRIMEFQTRSDKLDRSRLEEYWTQTLSAVTQLTGYQTEGNCYLYFGPGTVHLRRKDTAYMALDLSLPEHFNAAAISELFPHYISKMTFEEQHGFSDDLAYRIVEGGLSCFVTYQFHNGNITKAEALGYDNEAFDYCVREEEKLFGLLSGMLQRDSESTNNRAADDFKQEINRLYDIIGFYLGFRIVEAYTEKFGTDSWRELYVLPPAEVLVKSGLFP